MEDGNYSYDREAFSLSEENTEERLGKFFKEEILKSKPYDNRTYHLINDFNNGELNYGYCEDYDLFIGWNNDKTEYYLLNEYQEIKQIINNIKIKY